MFTFSTIKNALDTYQQQSTGILNSLTLWARGGESPLIANISAYIDRQKKEGFPENVNLSAKQLYEFIYLFMPYSTSSDRKQLMFAFAKVLPEENYWWFSDLMDACQKRFFAGSMTQKNFDEDLQRTAGTRVNTQEYTSLQLKVSHS